MNNTDITNTPWQLTIAANVVLPKLHKIAEQGYPDDIYVKCLAIDARIIGSLIYDLPCKFTGLVSTKLIDSDGYFNNQQSVNEHFYSRQRAGSRIIDLFLTNQISTITDVVFLLDKYRAVNKVTKEENDNLSQIQNKSHANDPWTIQYKVAGIDLVKQPPTRPHWMDRIFTVDGRIFTKAANAAEHAGITIDQLLIKCKSQLKADRGFTWHKP